MNRLLTFLERHPWTPLGAVVASFVLLAIPIVLVALLFFLGEAAIRS